MVPQSRGTSLPVTQRLALYKCSDVLMNTAVRQGLNLVPVEYIYSKRDPGSLLTGALRSANSIFASAFRLSACI